MLTPKFGSKKKGPRDLNSLGERQDIQQGSASQIAIKMKTWSSFQGSGPYWQNQQDMKQEDTSDFIEGKDWSPSYLKIKRF